MTLINSAFVSTAIIVSGDSRASITVPAAPGANLNSQVVLSDSAEKVFVLYDKFAAATSGDGAINNLPIAHYIEDFQAQNQLPQTVNQLANALLGYFRALNPIPACTFIVGGYDTNIPWVMSVDVAGNVVTRNNIDPQGNVTYGMQLYGDTAVAQRLLSQPNFYPPFNLLNQQDAVDFSRHLIRTTIDQLHFEPRFPSVGGPIDTVVVTPKGATFLVRKKLHGT